MCASVLISCFLGHQVGVGEDVVECVGNGGCVDKSSFLVGSENVDCVGITIKWWWCGSVLIF